MTELFYKTRKILPLPWELLLVLVLCQNGRKVVCFFPRDQPRYILGYIELYMTINYYFFSTIFVMYLAYFWVSAVVVSPMYCQSQFNTKWM